MWTYIQFERGFYALKIWFAIFFSYFELVKSSGGLNVIIKVWIAKILSNFKRKWLGNQQSKVYEPTYKSKKNFMLYKLYSRLSFRILNRLKVMAV